VKDLIEFTKNSASPDGFRPDCKECRRSVDKVWRDSSVEKIRLKAEIYYDNKRDHILSTSADYYRTNRDIITKKRAKKALENPGLKKNQSKAWRDANPDRQKELSRRATIKRLSTPIGRLQNAIKASVYACLAKGGKRGKKTFDILGYTPDELRDHLESRFTDGMSWENYGKWHVDHIIPLAAHNFDSVDHIDFKRAWALSNMQPLWAADNLKKNAKLNKPFQPSLAF
jgi:5-methylcytosine-specific restriction endonuclease McrA